MNNLTIKRSIELLSGYISPVDTDIIESWEVIRKSMEKYMKHTDDCKKNNYHTCSCGLDKILEQIEGE